MNRRGIALITVLFMVLMIVMLVTAALKTAPGNLAAANAYGDHQMARMAAEAGVRYARARLRENLSWRGGADTGPVEVVRAPDDSLVVVEDHGNVVGLLRVAPSEFAMFRIRFNYQDGSGNEDGLDDPSQHFLTLPFLSANNLTAASAVGKFRDDGSAVVDSGLDVPGLQAYVAVEGLAGPGLRDADPNNLNAATSGRTTRAVVEAHFEAGFGGTLDAAAMAAGNFSAYIPPRDAEPRAEAGQRDPRVEIRSVRAPGQDLVPPKARAKGTFGVVSAQGGANLYSADGTVDTQSGSLEAGTVANSSLQVGLEDPGAGFYQLGWDDIHHADSSPNSTEAVNLNAGTYVVWDDLKVHYYDMSYEDYGTHILANPEDPGEVLNNYLETQRNNFSEVGGGAIRLHHTTTEGSSLEAQLLIRNDVWVEPTASTADLTFITRRGTVEGPPAPDGTVPGELYPGAELNSNKVQFQFVPPPGKEATVSCSGKVTLGTRLWGDGGAITAEDDITIVGAGSLSALELEEGGDGLSLYSKGDIELNAYKYANNHSRGRYGDLKFNGVLYSWGDIRLKFAPKPDDPTPNNYYRFFGQLTVRGAVVAYGGDPGDAPGSGSGGVGAGRGNIELEAAWAKLVYDPKYIGSLDTSAIPDRMNLISWNLRE